MTSLELCLMQSRRLVACFAANMNILVSARTLLFCTAAFQVVGRNICWHMGLFFLHLHFTWLSIVMFLSAHLSKLLSSLRLAAQPVCSINHSSPCCIVSFGTHFKTLVAANSEAQLSVKKNSWYSLSTKCIFRVGKGQFL